jgi:hypothetical protein
MKMGYEFRLENAFSNVDPMSREIEFEYDSERIRKDSESIRDMYFKALLRDEHSPWTHA